MLGTITVIAVFIALASLIALNYVSDSKDKEIEILKAFLAAEQQEVANLERDISRMWSKVRESEQDMKVSRFRVGTLMQTVDYISKLGNTEDPKYYLEVSANLSKEAIRKLQITKEQLIAAGHVPVNF